jgi:hypothetical protein
MGTKTKTKFVKISSQLPTSAENVFKLIQNIETLKYIARPFATFKTIGESELKWKLVLHSCLLFLSSFQSAQSAGILT